MPSRRRPSSSSDGTSMIATEEMRETRRRCGDDPVRRVRRLKSGNDALLMNTASAAAAATASGRKLEPERSRSRITARRDKPSAVRRTRSADGLDLGTSMGLTRSTSIRNNRTKNQGRSIDSRGEDVDHDDDSKLKNKANRGFDLGMDMTLTRSTSVRDIQPRKPGRSLECLLDADRKVKRRDGGPATVCGPVTIRPEKVNAEPRSVPRLAPPKRGSRPNRKI
jgi:hypothetical protein